MSHLVAPLASTLEPTLIEDTVDRLYEKTKGNLFFKKGAGFFGSLLCRLNFQWTRSLETAAISTTTLYWNPDFFQKSDPDTRVTVLAHEICHNLFLHSARLGTRIPMLWNIAADHAVNLWLKEHGFYMGGFPYLMDPKYIGWSTEQIYDDLLQNAEEIPMEGYVLSADVMPCDEKQANEAVSNVVAAVMTARLSNAAGALPGEVEVVLDQFLNPKLPWERLLFNYMNELTDTERSYARPSRRYQDILMPGNTGRNGLDHLVYYLDVSGSVSDEEIALFNTEFKSVKEALEPERMTMVTFDTQIRNSYVFEKDQAFKKLVTSGRGGTCLKPVFEHMKKTAPTAAVIFSDMAVSIPPNPGIPIIWICVNSPDVTVPYGKLVHIST